MALREMSHGLSALERVIALCLAGLGGSLVLIGACAVGVVLLVGLCCAVWDGFTQ